MRQPEVSGTVAMVAVVVMMVMNGIAGQMVRFFDESVNVEEGEEFIVRVELVGTITENVRVIVEIDNDTGDDFIGDTQVATFTPSSSVAYATFTVRDDDEPENKELFYLRLILFNEGLYLGSPSTVPVMVEASDDAFGVFSFVEVSPVIVNEEVFTSVVNLRVERSVSYFSTIGVTFQVNSTSENAMIGFDLSPITGSVTFLPNQREATLQLQILADELPENDESFVVQLSYATFNARINVSEVTLVIKANDAPLRFSQETYLYDEGPGTKALSVDVTRGIDSYGNTIGPLNDTVSTTYRFEAGTASLGADFSATDGELVFEPGVTKKTIAFVIEDDATPELKESFKIRLLLLRANAVFVNPNVAEVSINANDFFRGVITFEPVGEGSGETPVTRINEDTYTVARFTVLRTEGTFGEVSVGWYVLRSDNKLAPVAQDVGPTEGRLVFGDGENEKQIELTIVQDSLPEPSEQFDIVLQADSLTGEAQVRGITTAKLTIEDSDNVYGNVEFGPDTSHRIEINTTPRALKLSVTRNGGRLEQALVNISVSYFDNDIEALPENIFQDWEVTITLPAGQDPTVVSIAILPSAFLTIGGRFVAAMDDVRLVTGPEYGSYNSPTLGMRKDVTVAVSETEANGESGFNNTADIVVEEPESGTVEIPLLIIREGMSGTAAIRWSVSGVGQSVQSVDDQDVAALAGTINIESGSFSEELVIIVQADNVPEIDEKMVVRLESIEPFTTQRLRPGATEIYITVLKNDNPGGVFQFATSMQDSYSVLEGVDPIEVVVERTGGDLVARSVQFVVEPDGAREFFGAPSALLFRPGVRTHSTTLLPINEGEPELAESFILQLLPLGNSTLGERTTINITVLESDFPYGRIQFKENPAIIYSSETVEGKPVNVTLVVQRDRGTFGEVTVPWRLSPATDAGLRPSSGTLVFQPGQDSYSLTLQVVDDDISEGDETYAVQLGQPTGGAVQGIPVVATVTITENDNPVVFTETLVYVEEPGTREFTVRRSGKLDAAVTVAYRTLDGSASTLNGDYQEIFRQVLSFASGESEKTVIVTVLDDVLPEGNETFTLDLFDATGDLLITDNSRATVIILANDDAYGVFSFETPATNSVEEGSTIYYNIVRARGIFGEVEVSWEMRTLQGTALPEGLEFQSTRGTVVFQPQAAQVPLAITPLADQQPEGQEMFRVVLTAVRVVTGLSRRSLARLSDTSLQMDVIVLASDDPHGRFAFPVSSQELSVAEDFYAGDEDTATTTYTVERRQGTDGTVQVLWEIFSEPFGTNLPVVYDLLFIGQRPPTMSTVPSKRREGTGTDVLSFSGAADSYVTIPSALEPTEEALSQGFSISTWLQPSPLCDGYIVARGKADGSSHYYSLRLVATAASTTLYMTISSGSSVSNGISPIASSVVVQDGRWHHVLVAVGNDTVHFYLDGSLVNSSNVASGVPQSGEGVLLVGAGPLGRDHFVGYMQDVRIWARTFDPSEVKSLYLAPPLTDVSPVSGVLSYAQGLRTGSFTVRSLQDIEEEGNEVFSVTLVAATGGATLSIADSRTTLTVLKSDNANGLFGFREACTPARANSESAAILCNVLRQRGDDGTVTVDWLVQLRTSQGLSSAAADFNNSAGSLVFLPGERLKTFQAQITEETLPELDEVFEIILVSATSDDGLVGSTNTSGASIDFMMQLSEITIEANDFPYGLLQFGKEVGVPPTPGDGGMIIPAGEVPTVTVSEEGGVVPLVVERAQGTLGSVSVEWRTIDRTAVSEGKIPPDYVGAAGRVDFVNGQLFGFVNITVRDNSLPEGEKVFEVELVNPTGGAAVGIAHSIMVTIGASDSAYGVYQFADDSLSVRAQETGDIGYKSVFLKVVRLGGTIGSDVVTWTASEDQDDGPDLAELSGSISFSAGQTEVSLEIKVQGDTQPELDEMATVTLTQVTKGSLGDSLKQSSTITIEANDDPYGYFVIINLQRPVRVNESPQDVSVTVRRLYGKFGTVDVGYQTLAPDETYNYLPGPLNRANYQDFTSVSGNVTFQAGQEYGSFTVLILDDIYPEQDESVFVRLTDVVLVQAAQMRPVTNSPRLGLESESYAQIIINSNDDANGVLQLSPTALTVAEGVDIPQLRVVRTGGTFGEVTVWFRAINEEARDLQDFSLLSQQVVLNSGETSKLVPVIIVDDRIPELSETFTIELLDQITGGAALGENRSAVITIEPSDDPNGVFEFASAGRSVQEPENGQPYSVDITVVRTGGSIDVVTLQWVATLNGEALVTDISPTSGAVYFVSNEASRPITVSILPDDIPEGNENIIITLLSASNGGRIGDQNTFQLFVAPNDSPHGYVQFASPVYTVQEGPREAQYLQLSRSGGTYGRLRVYYNTKALDVVSEATQDGSSILSYFSDPASGQRPTQGVAVDVAGAADQLMACLSACLATEACQAVQFGSTADEVSCVRFPDVVDDTLLVSAANFSVYNKYSEKVQSVLSTIARPGEDYSSVTDNSVLIQDGNTTGQLPVIILDDIIPELQEKFSVILQRVEVDDPAAVTQDEPQLGEISTASVTIATNDNANGAFRIYSDSPTADLAQRTVSYTEQDRLAVDLIVEREGGSIGEVTVTWQVNTEGRTAMYGTDFVADGATLTFTSGQTRRIVTVTILDDTTPENDERFTIQLVNPGGGASLGNDDHITVIILANDNVAGVLAFNTTSVLAAEGDQFAVGVLRTQSTQGTVTVRWIIDGLNGLQPQLGFQTITGTFIFLPGESEKTISLTVLSDDTPEINEEYQLRLFGVTTDGVGPTGAAIISPQFGTTSITIEGSNDPHGVLQFASTSLAVTIAEDAGSVVLLVDRKFGAIGTVRVTYSVLQGTISTLNADLSLASPGQDFIAVTNSFIDIPSGVTSASISVTILNDLLPEIDEVFLVRLMSVSLVGLVDQTSPPQLAGSGTVAEVKIGANDGAQGVIVFAVGSRSVSVDEVSPRISLTIQRTEGTFGQVSVMYYSQSVTEDTDAGTDYRLTPGEVVFAPGESQKNIVIEIINDALPEPDERFEVVLSNPKNGAALGQFVRATVIILANDGSAGHVSFVSPARVELQEPRGDNQTGSKAELSVQRGPGMYGRVTVPFVITNMFDVPSADVTPANGVVVFEDRQTTAVIEIAAVDDDDPETQEEFVIKLQIPDNGATLGLVTTATVIVLPSDAPYGLFEIYPAGTRFSNLDVEENVGTIHLDVVRTKGLLGRVNIDVTTSSGTAVFLSSSTNIILAEFQTVPAARISAWHIIETGGATFVLMLTSLTANEQLRSLLPTSSPVETGQSVLYRWQGELVYVRTLATDGATAADSFTVAGSTYFIIANSGREGNREVQTLLYRLDNDGSVEMVQGLTTYGAADVQHFVHNDQHYVAIANSLDDSSQSDISSFVYTWNPDTQKFGTSPTQQVATLYARAVEVFVIEGVLYMAVANYYDRASGSYEIDSIIYHKGTDQSFVQHQRLATTGAIDITFFTISGVHYLAVASNRQDVISSPQTSRLYRWDASTKLFLLHQDLSTNRVQTIRALTMQDGTVLLAIANSVGASDVLQWNVSQTRFTPAWTGDPFVLLQPITIQQPNGALHLLAAADVITENDGTLYQVARISEQSNYVHRRVTLTFEPAQTELHTTVVVLQDDTPEDTETFTVDVINPRNGAEIGPQSSVSINILSNDNAHGIIQFAPDSVNKIVSERDGSDNTILLSVVRGKGFYGHVSVRWVATGDHNGLQDISPLNGTVEFADGFSVATISLTIRDDDIAEFAEVTYIRLTQIVDDGSTLPSRGAQLGEMTQATVTVLANDSPFGVVSWDKLAVMASEPEGTDSIVALTVVRDQGLQGELRVSYVTSMALQLPAEQQATSGEDFIATQGSVTLTADARQANVQIVIKQDEIPEAAETFFVNLTEVVLVDTGGDNSAQPSIKIPGNVAQVTIAENDNAQGTVQFDVKTNIENRLDTYEEFGRNNTITLTVRRYVGFFGALTVNWQTNAINANNFDFFPTFGSVQFEDGQQTAEIAITIVDDQLPEEMESFDVKLIRVSGDAILGSVTSVRIAILKNDSPTGFFRFVSRETEIRESQNLDDSQGRAVLVVQRVQGTQGLVNVHWRLNAEAQDDFVAPLEGALQFIQGQIEQTLMLQSRPDSVLEGRETFLVSLVSADNNADISPTEGDTTVVILPDRGASGTISIVPTSRSVLIGEPGEYSPAYDGTAQVELSRATGIYGEVMVTWAITPRDTSAFMQMEGSVTFVDLQQTATITLQARDDSDPELRTSFTLQLNSASGGAVISTETGAAEANIVYVASDYPHGLFEFTLPETMSVSEDLTSVQATVRRTKGLVGQVQVRYTTTADTATTGQDFYPAAGVLVFENGVDSQFIQVSLRPDNIPEGPETFFINITSVQLLSPSDNDYTEVDGLQRDMRPAVGTVAAKTVVIEKNDNAEGIVEFQNTAINVQEEAGVAQIPIIRREGSYGVVTVSYKTQAITASSGVDYLPANGTLQLADGQEAAAVNVTLVDDSLKEFAEQFSITLASPTGGVLLGNSRTAVVTILKSDFPNGKFSFLGETERSIPNPLTQQTLVFYVERTEGLLGQQEVFWRIMGPNNPNLVLSDTNDVSYTSSGVETTSGRLTWGDGEAGRKQFSLTVKPYTSWEVAKTFVIEIYDIKASPVTIGNGEPSPTAGQVVLTVEKFGDPNGIIEFSGAATSVRELEEPSGSVPQQLGFPVVRQSGTGITGNVQIHWEVRGSGTEVSDVRPQNGTLLLQDGQRQGQITLQILPDDVPELTEEFTLVMTSVEGGAVLNAQASEAVFRIRYNDNPHGLFGILADNQQVSVDPVDLSRSLTLNFSRYAGTFGSAILTYTVTYNEPLSGVVLSSNTGTVTFSGGQQNVQTSVAIQGSGFLRLDSTFSLSLLDVQFVGDGVTQPPQLKAGQTDAQIPVPPLAANSEVSFLNTVVNVNDDDGTATVTVTRSGTYGSISVDWVTGQLVTSLPPGVTNGQMTPASGSVSITHGVDSSNVTVQVNARLGQAELFMVRLPRAPETPVSGGAQLAGQNLVATLDPAGVVRFMPTSLLPRVSELDQQVTVRVCRVYGVSGRVEVTYKTVDGSAEGNFDFRSIERDTVILQPGQAVVNISIPIFPDNIPEQSEQFYVRLTEVNQLPTPTQPVITPRLSPESTSSMVAITESNDPYGVLWFETDAVAVLERYTTIPLIIRRTGGLYGQISVKVRTVGGGETWTSDIVPSTDNTTRDTIAQALGLRNSANIATGGLDYSVLDTLVIFEDGDSKKSVPVLILDDTLPEATETVLVYLTQVTGGARVAAGTPDGGIKGYSEITIAPSDLSNGLIGFAEDSRNVEVNEDLDPTFTLTLTRLNAYLGNVKVFWKAKVSESSSDAEDVQLASQLAILSGNTTCLAESALCYLEVKLIDDSIPEERFVFVVKLVGVGQDAQLNEESLWATVTVLPSDYVNGLVQFVSDSRTVIVGDSAVTVRLGVERVYGLNYDVTVGYVTRMMELTMTVAGVSVHPALEREDYVRQQGTLVFEARTQVVRYIDVTLTPVRASRNPYPKQFFIDIHDPTSGASVSKTYNRSTVRIVRESDVAVWRIVTNQQQRPFNRTNLLVTLQGLDTQVQSPLTRDEVIIIDDMVKQINTEDTRQLSNEVLDSLMDLLCKLLDPSKSDATRGRHSLAERLEEFAYSMLTGSVCLSSIRGELITKSCAFVKVSAGRWSVVYLQGFDYSAQHKDSFAVPAELAVSTSADGTDDECVDFHLIEYNSRQWFPTDSEEDLLNNRVISFGLKGKPSSPVSDPVRFRIHTPDSRIATKRAQCVYFDTNLEQWVNPSDTCSVGNNLRMGTDDFVDCACSHMTSYAVVAEVYDSGIIGYNIWFYIACFSCMSCMLLAIVTHHLCQRQPTCAASLMQHLFFAVFATQLCLVVDAYLSPEDILAQSTAAGNYRCIVIGLFLHYFFLTQFMWIIVQAINLWKILVMNDEHTGRKYILFFALGWGLPLVFVAAFYAVTFNIYKYETDLPIDFIYGDVNNNGEICFLTNPYASVGGVIVPVLVVVLLSGGVFVKAFQLVPQWQAYDDIYRGRYNSTEVRLLLLVWSLLVLMWLWGGLHMVYGQLWMLVLFCILTILLGILVLIMYAVLRNLCLSRCAPKHKRYYTTNNPDIGALPPPSLTYNNHLTTSNNSVNMMKGSRTSLINEAWERGTQGGRSQMTVRRATPSQVYLNPPVAVVSPASISDIDPYDFDDLLYALKTGQSYTPSELSRSIADDDSQLSTKLDRYETKRIDIADTHL